MTKLKYLVFYIIYFNNEVLFILLVNLFDYFDKEFYFDKIMKLKF